nr:MAG TPA: Lantibiotic dehydratase domain protein, nisin, tRNA-dependent, dehydratase, BIOSYNTHETIC [Caudoviricetes sp.]
MGVLKSLCTPDCPRRSATCHAECEENLEYTAKKREVYAARAKKAQFSTFTPAAKSRARRVQMKKKQGRFHQ